MRHSGRSCKSLRLQTWLLDWQGRCVPWLAADSPPAQAACEEPCNSRCRCRRSDGKPFLLLPGAEGGASGRGSGRRAGQRS